MHVNFILIKGEESVLHNYIPDSHERVKTALRDWWKGQWNRLPHRWEAWFQSLRFSLPVGLAPSWLTARGLEHMQRHCLLTALFWTTNLWFWADTGVAVAALPEVVVPLVGVAKWDVNLLPSPFSHALMLAQTMSATVPIARALYCNTWFTHLGRGVPVVIKMWSPPASWVANLIAVLMGLGQGGSLNLWERKQMALEVTNKCCWLKFVLSCKTWKGQGADG